MSDTTLMEVEQNPESIFDAISSLELAVAHKKELVKQDEEIIKQLREQLKQIMLTGNVRSVTHSSGQRITLSRTKSYQVTDEAQLIESLKELHLSNFITLVPEKTIPQAEQVDMEMLKKHITANFLTKDGQLIEANKEYFGRIKGLTLEIEDKLSIKK